MSGYVKQPNDDFCWMCDSKAVVYNDVFGLGWCETHFWRDYLDDDWDD